MADKKIFSLGDGSLESYYDIQWLGFDKTRKEYAIIPKGNDPIVLLPHINFKKYCEYAIEISGLGQDRNWTIYYINKQGEAHSADRKVSITIPLEQGADAGARISLPRGICPQRLRLDPGESAGNIIIKKINIYEEKSQVAQAGKIYERCKGMLPEPWVDMLILSINNPSIGDMQFPYFPDPKFQSSIVGSAAPLNMQEMKKFYVKFNESIKQNSWRFTSDCKILDFGCGFGRLTRFFLKDTAYGNVYGADTVKKFINVCLETFSEDVIPAKNFINNEPLPPISFLDHSFDLITAYSVFTHLSEDAANKWIAEMRRILRIGGLLAITVRQKAYLDYCQSLNKKTNLSVYQHLEKKAFGNTTVIGKDFENGKFLYNPTKDSAETLDPNFYGDTVIPDKYIYENWSDKFNIIEIHDGYYDLNQSFVLMQAK